MEAGTIETKQPSFELEGAYESYPYSELVDDSLWQRLTGRIEKDEGVDSESSKKIMNEALGFLKACAENPDAMLAPSEAVDAGWHTFILYTKDYAEFCDGVAGRFLHHEPADGDPSAEGDHLMTIADTHDFLVKNGYTVDSDLWVSADYASTGEQPQASCGPQPPLPPQPPGPGCHHNCSVR